MRLVTLIIIIDLSKSCASVTSVVLVKIPYKNVEYVQVFSIYLN